MGGARHEVQGTLAKLGHLVQTEGPGEIGLNKSNEINKALPAKLAWRVLTEEEAIWCNMIRRKYGILSDGGLYLLINNGPLEFGRQSYGEWSC